MQGTVTNLIATLVTNATENFIQSYFLCDFRITLNKLKAKIRDNLTLIILSYLKENSKNKYLYQ